MGLKVADLSTHLNYYYCLFIIIFVTYSWATYDKPYMFEPYNSETWYKIGLLWTIFVWTETWYEIGLLIKWTIVKMSALSSKFDIKLEKQNMRTNIYYSNIIVKPISLLSDITNKQVILGSSRKTGIRNNSGKLLFSLQHISIYM